MDQLLTIDYNVSFILFFLQPASKDQVVGMLEKARAVMPAKPTAPSKAAASSAPAAKPASGSCTFSLSSANMTTTSWLVYWTSAYLHVS